MLSTSSIFERVEKGRGFTEQNIHNWGSSSKHCKKCKLKTFITRRARLRFQRYWHRWNAHDEIYRFRVSRKEKASLKRQHTLGLSLPKHAESANLKNFLARRTRIRFRWYWHRKCSRQVLSLRGSRREEASRNKTHIIGVVLPNIAKSANLKP